MKGERGRLEFTHSKRDSVRRAPSCCGRLPGYATTRAARASRESQLDDEDQEDDDDDDEGV